MQNAEQEIDGSDGEKREHKDERSYYYDDAHGYEDFNPEKESWSNEENDDES